MSFAKKALCFGVLSSFGFAAAATAQSALNGAGASFPAPFYQRAFSGLSGKGINVNYQSVGSGAGVRQFIAGTVDFGATDEPIKDAEAAKVKRGVVQFPAVGGTIAIAYNVGIFLGSIKTWDQLKCGKGPITVAHRSDGSGTTFAFTNSLSAFSSEWKSKVGEGKSVKWPVGVGGKGNEGVAGILGNTPGSIGYINQAFVKGKLKAAALQNKDGNYVLPTLAGGAAALNNIRLNAHPHLDPGLPEGQRL
ncbi:MAG: phosphate transporter substrate-binding protein PstS [Cyanobacteriota bacterium]